MCISDWSSNVCSSDLSIQLEIGVVGPAALGEETQNTYHRISGVDESNGWDNQIENEPGIVLSYERTWRGLWQSDTGKFGIDLTPYLGGSLGTVYTYAAPGAALRFGDPKSAGEGKSVAARVALGG